MHSSRMSSARLLTALEGGLPNPGGSASGGPPQGGLHPGEVCPILGGSASRWESAQSQGVCIKGLVCPTPGGSASRWGSAKPQGVCIQVGGLPNPGGSASRGLHLGGSASRGVHPILGVCMGGGWADPLPLWTEWHTSVIITLPQTSFAGGNKEIRRKWLPPHLRDKHFNFAF